MRQTSFCIFCKSWGRFRRPYLAHLGAFRAWTRITYLRLFLRTSSGCRETADTVRRHTCNQKSLRRAFFKTNIITAYSWPKLAGINAHHRTLQIFWLYPLNRTNTIQSLSNAMCHANTYMMLDAITALLSFPLVISQRFKRSRMTVTRNLFSCSSAMLPLMEPIAQHKVFRACQLHSLPLSCTIPPRDNELLQVTCHNHFCK
jgi:hypothetical protein